MNNYSCSRTFCIIPVQSKDLDKIRKYRDKLATIYNGKIHFFKPEYYYETDPKIIVQDFKIKGKYLDKYLFRIWFNLKNDEPEYLADNISVLDKFKFKPGHAYLYAENLDALKELVNEIGRGEEESFYEKINENIYAPNIEKRELEQVLSYIIKNIKKVIKNNYFDLKNYIIVIYKINECRPGIYNIIIYYGKTYEQNKWDSRSSNKLEIDKLLSYFKFPQEISKYLDIQFSDNIIQLVDDLQNHRIIEVIKNKED